MQTTESETGLDALVDELEDHFAVESAHTVRDKPEVSAWLMQGEIAGRSIMRIGQEAGFRVKFVAGSQADGGLRVRFVRDD